MKMVTYKIKGLGPMLMHNDRLANPFDPIVKQIKEITAKRKKTEDDLRDIARLEFLGGVYEAEGLGIVVPGWNIFACMKASAKLRKLGKHVERGVMIHEESVQLDFSHKGKAAEEIADDMRFRDLRTVKNSPTSGRIVRCRPIFRDWSLSFTVHYDEAVIQRGELDIILADAGGMIGLGDYRPRFGRFEVVSAQ